MQWISWSLLCRRQGHHALTLSHRLAAAWAEIFGADSKGILLSWYCLVLQNVASESCIDLNIDISQHSSFVRHWEDQSILLNSQRFPMRIWAGFMKLQSLSDLTMAQKEDVGNKMVNNNYIRRLLDVFRVCLWICTSLKLIWYGVFSLVSAREINLFQLCWPKKWCQLYLDLSVYWAFLWGLKCS